MASAWHARCAAAEQRGPQLPVAISHFPARRDETLELQVRRAVQALAEHPGDLLVFLPGQREIARVQAGLQESLDAGVEVLALHGEPPVEQQARVLQAPAMGAAAWCWRPSPSRR